MSSTTIQKSSDKKGISSTLYDPRKITVEKQNQQERLVKLRDSMKDLGGKTGFDACVNLPTSDTMTISTNN